jgi:putative oxidoreductase
MIWGIVTAHPPMEGQATDWKRLVQFALLGSSDLEQYANLPVRVSLGLFFALSEANKLFVAGSTRTMYETLVTAKVSFPHLMTYFVSGVEFVGGSLLTVGFLSSLAWVALLVDMRVAILTTKPSAMPEGLSPLNWFDDFLYLPEVLYMLFFIWLKSALVRESSVSVTGSAASCGGDRSTKQLVAKPSLHHVKSSTRYGCPDCFQ